MLARLPSLGFFVPYAENEISHAVDWKASPFAVLLNSEGAKPKRQFKDPVIEGFQAQENSDEEGEEAAKVRGSGSQTEPCAMEVAQSSGSAQGDAHSMDHAHGRGDGGASEPLGLSSFHIFAKSLKRRKIYIRECYHSLLEHIWQEYQSEFLFSIPSSI